MPHMTHAKKQTTFPGRMRKREIDVLAFRIYAIIVAVILIAFWAGGKADGSHYRGQDARATLIIHTHAAESTVPSPSSDHCRQCSSLKTLFWLMQQFPLFTHSLDSDGTGCDLKPITSGDACAALGGLGTTPLRYSPFLVRSGGCTSAARSVFQDFFRTAVRVLPPCRPARFYVASASLRELRVLRGEKQSGPEARFFAAIRQVESGGDSQAVGDGGRSRGAYQIGRAYWKDACRFGGVTWSYDRYVRDAGRCEQVMRWYWHRYVPGAYERGDLEVLARVHNGGPDGHRKKATLGYWRKVKKLLSG